MWWVLRLWACGPGGEPEVDGVLLSQVHPALADELTLAIQAHREGEAQAARAAVLQVYRDTFEPFEDVLRDHDPEAVLS
ncbi:MAG: hypothetical protein QGG40_10380, partial [Myxococcota bacterium]|nr:hypothetical protein [Myxococcota bacterium]